MIYLWTVVEFDETVHVDDLQNDDKKMNLLENEERKCRLSKALNL